MNTKLTSRSLNLFLIALTQRCGDVLVMSRPFPTDTISRLKTHVDEDHGQIGQLQVSRPGNCRVAPD